LGFLLRLVLIRLDAITPPHLGDYDHRRRSHGMAREVRFLDEPVVRVARASEAETLADILAEALYDDPPNVWAFPDLARRREILPRFFRLFDESIDSGGAFTLDDLAGVSLWFPPGWDMSEEQAAAFDGAV
jgi:hypothetical protein